jgi:hypothetical protein
MEKMNSLRPAGVDVTKKAGILVPLVDIEASLVVRVRRSSGGVRRSSVRVRRSSECCEVVQMVVLQAGPSSIPGSALRGGFSH